MVITVQCLSCDAVYETEATADAVRQIGRCMRCGGRTLRVVDEPDDEGEDRAEA